MAPSSAIDKARLQSLQIGSLPWLRQGKQIFHASARFQCIGTGMGDAPFDDNGDFFFGKEFVNGAIVWQRARAAHVGYKGEGEKKAGGEDHRQPIGPRQPRPGGIYQPQRSWAPPA